MNKKILKTSIFITLLATSLSAKDNFSIEIDPSTYAFKGYSVHLKKSFEAIDTVEFGLGIYAMDFPDIFVDINSKNKDKDWDVRLNNGIGLFVDKYSDNSLSGWFYGGQLAFQEYEIERNNVSSSYDTLLLMVHAGYKYQIDENFYAKFWGGVGYSEKISGSNVVSNTVYDVPEMLPFGALHLGYKF